MTNNSKWAVKIYRSGASVCGPDAGWAIGHDGKRQEFATRSEAHLKANELRVLTGELARELGSTNNLRFAPVALLPPEVL
jgi:hypothetical protein